MLLFLKMVCKMNFSLARFNMTQAQLRPNRVTSVALINAFDHIEREKFVPTHLQDLAYCDQTLRLPEDLFLLESLVLARLIEGLNVQPGDKVLNVACGSGYAAALLAHMGMQVFALTATQLQAKIAQENLAKGHISGTVHYGPLTAGLKEDGPFQAILIEGAVEHVPAELLAQLAEGGHLAAVMINDHERSTITIWQKNGNQVNISHKEEAHAPRLASFIKQNGFVF